MRKRGRARFLAALEELPEKMLRCCWQTIWTPAMPFGANAAGKKLHAPWRGTVRDKTSGA